MAFPAQRPRSTPERRASEQVLRIPLSPPCAQNFHLIFLSPESPSHRENLVVLFLKAQGTVEKEARLSLPYPKSRKKTKVAFPQLPPALPHLSTQLLRLFLDYREMDKRKITQASPVPDGEDRARKRRKQSVSLFVGSCCSGVSFGLVGVSW